MGIWYYIRERETPEKSGLTTTITYILVHMMYVFLGISHNATHQP